MGHEEAMTYRPALANGGRVISQELRAPLELQR